MRLAGANTEAEIRGFNEALTKSNYLLGSNSGKWLTGIANYENVRFENIYQGIDVIYKGLEENLEYDFHIAPEANPNLIQLEFEGLKKIKIDRGGDLILLLKSGGIRHKKPFAYQIIDGEKREITAYYVLLDKTRVGFQVGDYDRTKELIIDPVIYSTYLGGSRQDSTNDVAVDSSGYIYLASEVNSENFLYPQGQINTSTANDSDVFVTKLHPAGTQIIFNTVIGGTRNEIPWAMDIDSVGNIYVGGQTSSIDFPLINARQTTHSIQNQYDVEGFVLKLDSSGAILNYSTYHGATSNLNGYHVDWVESIDVDDAGNLYAVGGSGGSNFPLRNGFQMSLTGIYAAFLSKFDPSGNLLYSTLFNGADSRSFVAANDVAVDNQGNAYVSGEVASNSRIPISANAYQTSGDGFVAKFNTNNSGTSSLVWSTYTDSIGNAVGVDTCGSATVIDGGGRYRTGHGIKLNSTGSGAVFSFLLTGGVEDIAVSRNGNIYFAESVPDPNDIYGNPDVRVAGYSPTGQLLGDELIHGSYREYTTGIAVDSNNIVYSVGYTGSLDFPTSPGALQRQSRYAFPNGSSRQGFLAKVELPNPNPGGTLACEEKEPLIFVPGVSGSLLDAIESNGSRTNLWLGLLQNHDRLTLDPNQTQANIIATDAIRTVFIPVPIPGTLPQQFYFYPQDAYRQILERLTNQEHYVEYQVNGQPSRRTFDGCDVSGQMANRPNLFVFAYDWRKSNIENAQALKEYVGCVRRFYPDSKVNILAHSMGGLLARRYIISNPNDHHVDKMVTIGSPWLGAPKAIDVLKTGNFGLSPIVANSTIRRLGEFFKGMHELLPSRTYFDAATRSDFHLTSYGNPFKEDGWDVNGNGNAFESYGYDQTVNLLNQQQPRSNPGSNNQLLHDTTGQDNWLGDTSGVKYFHIYGQQSYLNTTVQVIAKYRIKCHQAGCQRENYYDLVRGRGDKTVPTISAERSFGPYYNLLPRNDKPFFSPNRSQDESVEHTGLTQNPDVQQEAINFLNSDSQQLAVSGNQSLKDKYANSTESLQESGAESIELPLREGYYVNISGVNYVEIKDDLGNVNTPLDGGYMLPVPSINYDLASEKSIAITTPTEGNYTLTFRNGNEPIFLEAIKGMGNLNPTEAIRYLDLNLPANVNAQFQVSSTGITDLHYDSDGNGTFETLVLPTSHTTGNAAKDLTPPTIQINEIVQPSRQLIINSSDANSGVRKTYYSFDSSNFQEYVGSIPLARSQSGTIYTFADDNSANRSLISTYTFVPIPDPVVTIASPLSGSVFSIGISVNFTGSFSGDSCNSHTAFWTFDNISQAGMVNETNRTVTANHAFTSAGVYLVSLTVNNNCGGTGTTNIVNGLTAMVVIYDPDGGFVTGGGWIDSSVGAYPANPNLTGRASFGFNSKYQRGANVPTGNTEFQFRVADFNFKSTSYDWLVVGGAKAQYKGSGTINNSGNYAFMLTAIDGQINGGGGTDKFRIKIWNKTTNVVIYDNQIGSFDNENPTAIIGGGSIIIHRQ